jgi:hypothetical protein
MSTSAFAQHSQHLRITEQVFSPNIFLNLSDSAQCQSNRTSLTAIPDVRVRPSNTVSQRRRRHSSIHSLKEPRCPTRIQPLPEAVRFMGRSHEIT